MSESSEEMESKKQETAVATWDFTIFLEVGLLDFAKPIEILTKILREHGRKWCFQQEIAPTTGRHHFQGRVTFGTKKRTPAVLKLLEVEGCKHASASKTSNHNRDNNFYVSKPEKVDGPWKDTDPKAIYIPRDIRDIVHLRLWQEWLKKKVEPYNQRDVICIYDPQGNNGKSIFSRYMACHGLATKIPFCNDFKDIMRMVMCMPKAKCYIIDMPRAINKDKLHQLYGAIEAVKTGECYDERYSYKSEMFDPPQIIVFTNVRPEIGLLSIDRWKLYSLHDNCLYEGLCEHAKALLDHVPFINPKDPSHDPNWKSGYDPTPPPDFFKGAEIYDEKKSEMPVTPPRPKIVINGFKPAIHAGLPDPEAWQNFLKPVTNPVVHRGTTLQLPVPDTEDRQTGTLPSP